MNTEELKYLTALLEKIAERMGEWRVGEDRAYWPAAKESYIIQAIPTDNSLLRIPLAIDPENPERGLWGMVDWSKLKPSINSRGNIAMWVKGEDGNIFPQAQWNYPPYLVLLRCLAKQWGIEVKKDNKS